MTPLLPRACETDPRPCPRTTRHGHGSVLRKLDRAMSTSCGPKRSDGGLVTHLVVGTGLDPRQVQPVVLVGKKVGILPGPVGVVRRLVVVVVDGVYIAIGRALA